MSGTAECEQHVALRVAADVGVWGYNERTTITQLSPKAKESRIVRATVAKSERVKVAAKALGRVEVKAEPSDLKDVAVTK